MMGREPTYSEGVGCDGTGRRRDVFEEERWERLNSKQARDRRGRRGWKTTTTTTTEDGRGRER